MLVLFVMDDFRCLRFKDCFLFCVFALGFSSSFINATAQGGKSELECDNFAPKPVLYKLLGLKSSTSLVIAD